MGSSLTAEQKAKVKQKAFDLFDNLQPGQVLVISKEARRDPEGFREYAKEYIDRGGFIEFTNDYRKLKGLERIDWKKLKKLPIPA